MKKSVNISQIIVNPDLLARNKVNESVVASYLELLQGGVEFPPITLFNVDGTLILASGLHRLEVYKNAQFDRIPAIVIEGSLSELKLHSIQSNAIHGLQYTNEEKRRCVTLVFSEETWKDWSDNHIAKMCGVSNHFVKKVREEVGAHKQSNQTVYIKNGHTHKMTTEKIGQNQKSTSRKLDPVLTRKKIEPSIQQILDTKSFDIVRILKIFRASYSEVNIVIPEEFHKEIANFVEWFQSLEKKEG